MRLIRVSAIAAMLVLVAPAAHSLVCEGVAENGECIDSQTLIWCDDGQLMEAACPESEICSDDHPSYEGANCIRYDQTECADVVGHDGDGNEIALTVHGACTTAGNVIACDGRGEVQVTKCVDEGSTCDCLLQATDGDGEPIFDEDSGDPVLECDCVSEVAEGSALASAPGREGQTDVEAPEGTTEPEAGAGAGAGGGAEGGDPEATDGDEAPRGPTPEVSAGGALEEESADSGGGGCHGGHLGGHFGDHPGGHGSGEGTAAALLLGLFAVLAWRRRRGAAEQAGR